MSRAENDGDVDGVFAAWYERSERGTAETAEELIRAHPELAPELAARIAALDILDQAFAPHSQAPEVPDRIGPFAVRDTLGAGGMGSVYRVQLTEPAAGLETGAIAALKVVHPHLLARPGFFKRFLREADLGRRVEHPNVVRTLEADAVLQGGRHFHFLVMEFVEGRTLRDLLDDLGRVPEELCRHIGSAIGRGLAAIHATGAVHRDLKPENVLITDDHEVKVMDLGVARLQDEAATLSQPGAFIGSIHYSSPEQFKPGLNLDRRADLHALGLVLYELACGQHPYYDADVHVALERLLHSAPRRVGAINPQLSPYFEEVVHKLIAKDRDERFDDAHQLVDVLTGGEESKWWQGCATTLRLTTNEPLRRVRIPRETALYGRESSLATLDELWGLAADGVGRVLIVEGEAGIGKTRLVDEFVGRLRAAGSEHHFLFGSYPPAGAGSATGAIGTAVREHFGDERLESALRDALPDTRNLVPAFAAALRGDPPPPGHEGLTRESLHALFVLVVRSLARERPTVFLVDDLHFAGAQDRSLFAALALAIREHAVLLVGTTRPGTPPEWLSAIEQFDHATKMTLPRLGPKELMRLLEDSFRSERLAERLGHRIAVKSDGNPFFAFEIIRGLRERQFITQSDDGTWISTRLIEQIQIPSTVLDLIQARISDLTNDERNLLEVAACCGFTFDGRLVADVVGSQRIPALQQLGRIEKTHRLVRSAGQSFVFDHHQVQEALYAAISEPLREEYHDAIAGLLEQRADERIAICEHFYRARRPDRAAPYLDEALDQLAAGHHAERALELLEQALEDADAPSGQRRIDLLLRMAGLLQLLGRSTEERVALEDAATIARQLGDDRAIARAQQSLGSNGARQGRYEDAAAHLTCAIECAVRAGAADVQAAALGNLANVCFDQGRHQETREHAERCAALSRESGDRRTEGMAIGVLGLVAHEQGSLEEAREHFQMALDLAQETGNRRGESIAVCNLGNVALAEGRHDEAARCYESQLALSRESGARLGEATAIANLGALSLDQGAYAAALEHLERNLALAQEVGHRRGEAIALHNLGEVAAALGRIDAARAFLEDALAVADDIGFRLVQGHASRALGDVAQASGDTQQAASHFQHAVSVLREVGATDGVANALVDLGAAHAVRRDLDEARHLFVEALTLCETTGTTSAAVLAACHLASLPGGDHAAAARRLAGAGQRLPKRTQMRAHHLLWKANGDPAHAQAAVRLLRELQDAAPPQDRTSMIENVPLHREIAHA